MEGLRNSDMIRGIDILTQVAYDALTQKLKGTLYVVGVSTAEEYTPSEYTASEFTQATATDATVTVDYTAALAATTNAEIDDAITLTQGMFTEAEYTASEYTQETHTHEVVEVSAVYIGTQEQSILLNNDGKVVWMSDAVKPDSFTNEPIPLIQLV